MEEKNMGVQSKAVVGVWKRWYVWSERVIGEGKKHSSSESTSDQN